MSHEGVKKEVISGEKIEEELDRRRSGGRGTALGAEGHGRRGRGSWLRGSFSGRTRRPQAGLALVRRGAGRSSEQSGCGGAVSPGRICER